MISLDSLKPLFKNRHFLIGIALLLPPLVLTLIGPLVIPWEASRIGYAPLNQPPSSSHLFGTDGLGRDVLAILTYSIGNSYAIGVGAGSVSILIGLTVGLLAGYKGGILDDVLSNVTNMFLVIPTWPLLVILSAYTRVLSVVYICLIIGLFSWTGAARAIRSQVMTLKERGFVDVAKLSGLREIEVAFKEVLPNILTYLGVIFVNMISGAITAEVGLQIIGIGPQGYPTLGLMIYWCLQRGAILKGMWWWLIPPIFCLAAIFIGLHLLNIGLDSIFNPRLREY